MTWPPEFSIRESARAKHWSLHISPTKGLEVVVPIGFKTHKIPDILEEKRRWIQRHLPKVQAVLPTAPPSRICLPSIDEIWNVDYQPETSNRIRVFAYKSGRLVVKGRTHQLSLCHQVLFKWLQSKGRHHLGPWLCQLSQETQLPYRKLQIRNQRTLWGSCAPNNDISLNCKLLLLERELARYVMIHELCHTVHHNHSKSFWRLVSRFVPNVTALRKQLNKAQVDYFGAPACHL